jgi:ribosomal protein S18 acetylase RimI-like enzyme
MWKESSSDEESVEEVDYSQTVPFETYESESDNEQAVGLYRHQTFRGQTQIPFEVYEEFCDVKGHRVATTSVI